MLRKSTLDVAAEDAPAIPSVGSAAGNMADLKRAFEEARARRRSGSRTLLFVDEVHRFNRAQQDGFLPVVEDGTVVLVGARGRLQAPLVVGALVLGVVGVDLLGPYAAALPRWLSLGAAGALLLGVGATYEQRRRDLDRLRARYDALA